MTYTGTLYTVSAPSGAGKTSLVKALIERCAGRAGICLTHHPAHAPGGAGWGELPLSNEDELPGMLERASFWSMPGYSATSMAPRGSG